MEDDMDPAFLHDTDTLAFDDPTEGHESLLPTEEGELDDLLSEIVRLEPLSAPLDTVANRVAQFHFDGDGEANGLASEDDLDDDDNPDGINIDDVGISAAGQGEEAFQLFRDQLKESTGIGARRRRQKRRPGRRPGRMMPKLSSEVQNLLGAANMSYVTQEYDQAVATLQEVIRLEPKAFQAWHSLALIQEELGDKPRALMLYLVAAHITPWDGPLWKRLGHLSLEQNEPRQALYCFSKAVGADKGDGEALLERSQLYVDLGKFTKAVDDLAQYLRLNPHDVTILRALAQLGAAHHLYEPVLHAYERLFYLAYLEDQDPTGEDEDEVPDREAENEAALYFTASDLNIFAELCMMAGDYERLVFHVRRGSRYLQRRNGEAWWATPDESEAVTNFRHSKETCDAVDEATRRADMRTACVDTVPPVPPVPDLTMEPEPVDMVALGEFLSTDHLRGLLQLLRHPPDATTRGALDGDQIRSLGEPSTVAKQPRTGRRARHKPRARRGARGGAGDDDEDDEDDDINSGASSASDGESGGGAGLEGNRNGKYRPDAEDIAQALDTAENHPLPVELRVKLAQAYLHLQQPDLGLLHAAYLWEYEPVHYADLYHELIETLMRCDLHRAALDVCEVLLADEATASAAVWALAARCQRRLGELETAIEYFKHAITENPADLEGQLSLAELYQETERPALALEWFRKVEQSRTALKAQYATQRLARTTNPDATASTPTGPPAGDGTDALPDTGTLLRYATDPAKADRSARMAQAQMDSHLRRLVRAEKDVALWFRITDLLETRIVELQSELTTLTATHYRLCEAEEGPVGLAADREAAAARQRTLRDQTQAARQDYCQTAYKLYHHFRHTPEFYRDEGRDRFSSYRITKRRLPTAASLVGLLNAGKDEAASELSLEGRIGRIMEKLNLPSELINLARGQVVPAEYPSRPVDPGAASSGNPAADPPAVTEDQVIPTMFRGVSFVAWRAFFTRYSFHLVHLDRYPLAVRILNTVRRANVYRHDATAHRELHALAIAIARHSDDFDLIYPLARSIVTYNPAQSNAYRVFSALLAGGPPHLPHLAVATVAKVVSRHLNDLVPNVWRVFSRALTFHPADAALKDEADHTLDPARRECTALVATLKGRIHLTRYNNRRAVHILQIARDFGPRDVNLDLLLGVSLLQRATQRAADNRQLRILEGFQHLFTYFEMIMADRVAEGSEFESSDDSGAGEGQEAPAPVTLAGVFRERRQREALYNMGRAFHLLNLTYLAVPYYEAAVGMRPLNGLVLRPSWSLDSLPAELQTHFATTPEPQETIDQFLFPGRREAAYNLHHIYMGSGNPELAQYVLQTYCTI
ncbi:transcription factor TFIIIC subunit tfc4 [Tieghemiomyces parasiticus]|uniref:Transcription factor TFIIIC subunit tfc4 n=1 Tax=Tieghemiomyces parasiticus TaxID=78921 RepID=A0A9W7ZNX2_9FUNG|nr:transcription factor TFIIIC subunit tfc4 [Tieghemiomyces parasiticus]